MRAVLLVVTPALFAMYVPTCAPRLEPLRTPEAVPMDSLWEYPADITHSDLFYGPWGPERAPDATTRYRLQAIKRSGVNPGMSVRDTDGRKWSVKQAPPEGGQAEGPVEVTLSRVLSAVGYHQPPVYFLPSFTLVDNWGEHRERGGRFRLSEPSLKDRGDWSWQRNPFVGTMPYQGLLVILVLFNGSDLKNSNNTLYEHRGEELVEPWFVVRDLGTALGETGRFAPRRGDPDRFERQRFITGIRDGFVEFDYHGYHQELVRGRIRPAHVLWACNLLALLADAQWDDAFRAGGFAPRDAARFIRKIKANIATGRQLGLSVDGPEEEG
jgi:hypothetical protein